METGPPRVKLRNSAVFSFITSARISCGARTPFYSLPKQRYKTVLSTKVLTKGSLEMKFGEQKIENGNFWSGALVTSKLLLWLFLQFYYLLKFRVKMLKCICSICFLSITESSKMGWWGCKCKCSAGWRRGEARGKGGDSKGGGI